MACDKELASSVENKPVMAHSHHLCPAFHLLEPGVPQENQK
jgi:hypothetical protein